MPTTQPVQAAAGATANLPSGHVMHDAALYNVLILPWGHVEHQDPPFHPPRTYLPGRHAIVGATVGALVGVAVVGALLGRAVGALVGMEVGVVVGASVGALVGPSWKKYQRQHGLYGILWDPSAKWQSIGNQ